MIANYHTHCKYCDGLGEPEEFAKAAIEQGLSIYGFSCHAPLGKYPCSLMDPRHLNVYAQEIRRLKKKYENQITILLGLEIDYVSGVMGPHSAIFQNIELDYTIGAVHYIDFFENGLPMSVDRSTAIFQKGLREVFANNYKKLYKRYFRLIRKMLREQPPDIIAHIDKISRHNIDNVYFSEKESWYSEEVDKTLCSIKDAGTIIEFNTRGLYSSKHPRPYPSLAILKKIHEMDLPLMINTDAHKPDEIKKGYNDALKIVKKIGFESVALLKCRNKSRTAGICTSDPRIPPLKPVFCSIAAQN